MPHSRISIATDTPVHSLQLVRPWIRCTSDSFDPPRHSLPLLPEHSRKWMRETAGMRFKSSTLNTSGRSTIP